MAAEPLTIQGEHGAYPVVIQPGALTDALPAFVHDRGFSRAAVITNTTLAPLYGEALAARLPGGFLVTVPDGEAVQKPGHAATHVHAASRGRRGSVNADRRAGRRRDRGYGGLRGGNVHARRGARPGPDQPAGDGRFEHRRQGRRRSAAGQKSGRARSKIRWPFSRIPRSLSTLPDCRVSLRAGGDRQSGADR